MKIDITYALDELDIFLSDIHLESDVNEVERRIDILLLDYRINRINFSFVNVGDKFINKLNNKYKCKIKEA